MKALIAGAAVAAMFATTALADFYVIQEPTTKRCRIVEERPAPGIGVVIGDRGLKEGVVEYQHRRDAEATKVPLAQVAAFVRERLAR
mgnify:CR=1 FL=1